MAAAESEVIAEVGKQAQKPAVPLLTLVAAMLGAVLVAVAALGGVGFWLVKSGKLPMGGASAKTEIVTIEVAKEKPELAALEPLLVNLADTDGRSYLRIGVTLVIQPKPVVKGDKAKEEKPEKGKPVNEHEAAERDALLSVLGRQTGEALLGPDGKEQLKLQMRAALKSRVPDVIVDDILITEFLVQR
jgi:flagellar FliL protein